MSYAVEEEITLQKPARSKGANAQTPSTIVRISAAKTPLLRAGFCRDCSFNSYNILPFTLDLLP
jgi:hypothetical protein